MTLAQWYLFPNSNPSDLQTQLKNSLQGLGYTFYDPFAGGTGTPVGLQQRVRCFIGSLEGGWARMIFAPNEVWPDEVTRDILAGIPVIRAVYTSAEQYEVGTVADGMGGLTAFLRPGLSETDLQQSAIMTAVLPTAQTTATTLTDLPPELQKYAQEQGVDAGQVDKLMQKMSKGVFKKMGNEQDAQKQAKSAIAGVPKQPEVEWNSPAGQALQRVMACLTVPENWAQPDWKTLTGAYQAARQLQRDPKALMLPGDKQAMAALPNSLEFIPLYMGKKSA
ncbi:MAG: hypothetical protein DPW16_11460 [Chloroflexi bacterium]|nr:hypothetical protein [Chloroflexota bacterium]